MDLVTEISKRLKEKGWFIVREGAKHIIWRHPNGSVYTLPRRIKDNHRKRLNILRNIKNLEGGGK